MKINLMVSVLACAVVAACGAQEPQTEEQSAPAAPPVLNDDARAVLELPFSPDLSQMSSSSEVVTVSSSETGVTIEGGNIDLIAGGIPEGATIVLPMEFAEQASGSIVVAVFHAFNSGEAATEIFVSYSTNEAGNSGWRAVAVEPGESEVRWGFQVPENDAENEDYLSVIAPTQPIGIASASIEIRPAQ